MKCSECKNYATTKCVICVGSNQFKSENDMSEIKIEIPEGHIIDIENSNLKEGIIKFKQAEKQLPKTWEEFCKTHPIKKGECYIKEGSEILDYKSSTYRPGSLAKNVGTKETCEAVLALMQLIQLRDCYNDGWVPNWNEDNHKFIIYCESDEIAVNTNIYAKRVLTFKTEELRNQFLKNFRNLIEIAKPLI